MEVQSKFKEVVRAKEMLLQWHSESNWAPVLGLEHISGCWGMAYPSVYFDLLIYLTSKIIFQFTQHNAKRKWSTWQGQALTWMRKRQKPPRMNADPAINFAHSFLCIHWCLAKTPSQDRVLCSQLCTFNNI